MFDSVRKNLRKIPLEYRRWSALGILSALLLALPIMVWGLTSGRFEIRKRAATGEVTPLPLATCRQSCGSDKDCQEGLRCGTPCPAGVVCPQSLFCYNPVCPFEADCVCSAISPTPACSPEGGPCSYGFYGQFLGECCPGFVCHSFPDGGLCVTPTLITPTPTPACSKEGGPCGSGFYGQPLGECCQGLICRTFPDGGVCERPLISTPTPTPISKTLRFKLKFAGVTSRPIDDSVKEVLVYATSLDGGPAINYEGNKMPVQVRVDDSGVYHGEISFAGYAFFGHHYRLRVKGPKHLQEVFSDVVFDPGTELDLTGKPLRPGDVNFDGILNITDLQEVGKRIFSTNPSDIAFADVNFDKRIDIVDRTLILNTLLVQYDLE